MSTPELSTPTQACPTQPKVKLRALISCQAIAGADDVPERERLRELQAIALQKAGLWPGQLFAAMDGCKLVGRGLLMCAVDLRGAQGQKDAVLQTPILTKSVVANLCKRVESNQAARACNNQLRNSLQHEAIGGFQFVPSDFWKRVLEPICMKIKIARQSLKATKAIVILTWFVLPGAVGRVAVLEQCLVRPGATLPNTILNSLNETEKASMWETVAQHDLETGSLIKCAMGVMGLDPEVLQGVPQFQMLLRDFRAHLSRWYRREELHRVRLIEAWCPFAEAVAQQEAHFDAYVFGFFHDNSKTVMELRDIMGLEKALATAAAVIAQRIARAHCQERYAAGFHNEFAFPCPSCGKPLAGRGGYQCECQRPALPPPPALAQASLPPPEPAMPPAPTPSYRRNTNIQTSFGASEEPKPNERRPAAKCSQQTPKAPTSASTKPHTKQASGKRGKTSAPTAAAAAVAGAGACLPQAFRSHNMQEFDGQGEAPEAASVCCRKSRKGRRRAPQGDRKLAQTLAAEELMANAKTKSKWQVEPQA